MESSDPLPTAFIESLTRIRPPLVQSTPFERYKPTGFVFIPMGGMFFDVLEPLSNGSLLHHPHAFHGKTFALVFTTESSDPGPILTKDSFWARFTQHFELLPSGTPYYSASDKSSDFVEFQNYIKTYWSPLDSTPPLPPSTLRPQIEVVHSSYFDHTVKPTHYTLLPRGGTIYPFPNQSATPDGAKGYSEHFPNPIPITMMNASAPKQAAPRPRKPFAVPSPNLPGLNTKFSMMGDQYSVDTNQDSQSEFLFNN